MEQVKRRICDDPKRWAQVVEFITSKPPGTGAVIHRAGVILWMNQRAISILEPPPDAETIYDISFVGKSLQYRTAERIETRDTSRYIIPHKGRVSKSLKVLEMTPCEISLSGENYRLVFIREMLQSELERKECLKTLVSALL